MCEFLGFQILVSFEYDIMVLHKIWLLLLFLGPRSVPNFPKDFQKNKAIIRYYYSFLFGVCINDTVYSLNSAFFGCSKSGGPSPTLQKVGGGGPDPFVPPKITPMNLHFLQLFQQSNALTSMPYLPFIRHK